MLTIWQEILTAETYDRLYSKISFPLATNRTGVGRDKIQLLDQLSITMSYHLTGCKLKCLHTKSKWVEITTKSQFSSKIHVLKLSKESLNTKSG